MKNLIIVMLILAVIGVVFFLGMKLLESNATFTTQKNNIAKLETMNQEVVRDMQEVLQLLDYTLSELPKTGTKKAYEKVAIEIKLKEYCNKYGVELHSQSSDNGKIFDDETDETAGSDETDELEKPLENLNVEDTEEQDEAEEQNNATTSTSSNYNVIQDLKDWKKRRELLKTFYKKGE